MKKILIVEDSKLISLTLKKVIENNSDLKCMIANSKAECEKLLLLYQNNFEVALLDLGLPDALDGEVIDVVEKTDIPIIVLSNMKNKENVFKEKNILDYVIKDGPYSIFYVANIIKQLIKNKGIKVLVVDDSKFVLETISALLERYNLQVFKAINGEDALSIFKQHPDIKLLFTDYEMPKMDGIKLIRTLRKEYQKNQLSIVVMTSSTSKENTASKFLKYGANDFINKNFTKEEFYTRLNSNLEILSLFEEVELESEKNREKDKLLLNQSKMLAITDLLHNISHHWRQPLNVISNITATMETNRALDMINKEEEERGLKDISRITQDLSQTIEDFVTFFRKDEFEEVYFSLNSNISHYINLIKPSFDELGISIVFNPNEEYSIMGNQQSFNQILLNILNNSKEAFEKEKPTHAKIQIDICQDEKNIILTIQDNAKGIEKNIMDKIFEPYFTTKHQDYGKGMGLYLSKEIMEKQFKGTIAVKNIKTDTNNSIEAGVLVSIIIPK